MRDGEVDTAARGVHVVVLAIPIALVIASWMWGDGASDAVRWVLQPAILVVNTVLLVGLVTRRLSLRTVGPWVVLSLASVLVARLVAWELIPASRPENFGLVVGALAWFGVVFALSFLVFGTRRGAQASLAGYAMFCVGAGWSASSGMLAESGATGVVVFLAAGHAALILIVWVLARDVAQLSIARTRAELLELQATTDPLTGIANRRRLDDEVQRLIAQSRRYGHALSVVLADLDQFKDVNDSYGHEVGDEVLVASVGRLRAAVREADVLGRWGGEEFLLLAPATDHADACALAERCRQRIAEAPLTTHGLAVTASFGVATLGPGDDARAVMRRADLALYAAKREGRDRVVGIPDSTFAPAQVKPGEPDVTGT